jgi:hypothetical protein
MPAAVQRSAISPEPERDLDALGRDPERDHVRALAEVVPSVIITAKRTSSRRRLISSPSERRVRSMKVRETDERDVDRAYCSTSWPTGSCVLR